MTRTTTLWSLLLLSAALALGSCTKDATEQATGPEPEAKAASKLVFSSENAVRGELLVCFGEEAVAGIESSVMQVTRSGGVATRSGIADFDAVLGSIGVKATASVPGRRTERGAHARRRPAPLVRRGVR